MDNYYTVATIASPFGLEGGLKIRLTSDFPERFLPGRTVYIMMNGFPRKESVADFSMSTRDGATIFLESIKTREDAEKLVGFEVVIPEDEVREFAEGLDSDSFLYCDILEKDVYLDNQLFGKVTDVVEAGGGSILIIESDGKEVQLPFVTEMVDTGRIGEGRIDIYPVEGLFEE